MLTRDFAKNMVGVIILCVLFMTYSGLRSVAQDYSNISQDEFNALKVSVEQTETVLDNIKGQLQFAKEELKKLSKNPQKAKEAKNLIKTIEETENVLAAYKKPIKKFNKYADKASSAVDIYSEIYDIHEKYQKDKALQGELGGNLRLLSIAMQKFGDKVPLLGDAIKAYGDITAGLLDKTMQVGLAIDQNRNQGAISGPGSYAAGYSREKNQILKQKYSYLADNLTYVPTTPAYVYRATEGDHPVLIWDEETKDFYLVKSDVPVEKLFKMKLLVDHRPEAKEMKVLTDNWETVGFTRLKTGLAVQTLFEEVSKQAGYPLTKQFYYQVKDQNLDIFYDMFHDLDTFNARYMFDPSFRAAVDNTLKQFYVKLDENEQTRQVAKELFDFVRQNGINIELPQPRQIATTNAPPSTPRRIQENNNNTPTYQPPQNNSNNVSTNTYQPSSSNQAQIEEASRKNKEIENGKRICALYMQALTKHYDDYDTIDGKYWVQFTRSYEYEDGNCIGSHEVWRKIQGKDPYVEVYYYSPEAPAKLPVAGLKSHYSKEYPALGWPD